MIAFRKAVWVTASATAAALVSTGCGLMEPRAERYVAPPVGTTWVTSVRNTGSYGSGSRQSQGRRGERMWEGAPVITWEGGPAGTIFARQNGNWIGIFQGDKPVITWEPLTGWQWPLEVGKSWTQSMRMTIHATNTTIPFERTQKVEAYEDVTVPAGTFKAYRISTVNTLGDQNVIWYSPEHGIFLKQMNRRTEKHRQGPGTQDTEVVSYKRGGE